MSSLQREDRQLLENQVRGIDDMIRQMQLMRSTLDRRIRRMNSQRAGSPPRARQPRQPQVPNAPRANRVREPANSSGDSVAYRVSSEGGLQPPLPEEIQMEPMDLEEAMNQVENPPPNQDNHVYDANYVQTILQMILNGQLHFHEIPHNLQIQISELYNDHAEEIHPPVQREVRRVKLPKLVIAALNKNDVSLPMSQPCPVCMESYTKIQSRELNCQHHMCTDCMDKWQTSQCTQGHDINCPLCRVKTTCIVGYRERAKRTTK